MKIHARRLVVLIALLLWCLFMGIMAIALGFGAVFPPLDLVAQPFVCPNGQMTYDQTVSNPLPGTTYTRTYWYCVDTRTGAKAALDPGVKDLYAGTLYGLLLFAVALIVYRRIAPIDTPAAAESVHPPAAARAPRDATAASGVEPASASDDLRARKAAAERGRSRHEAEQRLRELKAMHTENLISQAEYDEKRAEILKDL